MSASISIQDKVRVSCNIQLRAQNWDTVKYSSFHENILSLPNALNNVFKILEFLASDDSEAIRLMNQSETSDVCFYLSYSSISGGKLNRESFDWKTLNEFYGKLIDHMSYADAICLIHEIIEKKDFEGLTSEEWCIYMENIDSYKSMPIGWWLPLVKNKTKS